MKIDNKELEKIFLEINQNRSCGIKELYSKYKKIVYGVAFTISKNKTDAEDITQIIFAKICEMEKSKIPTNNYASWLYSITKNETINFLKKKKNNISLEKIYEISDDNNEINKVIDNIEFNKLISKLNEKEKEIISLKILSNFSFEEIGKLLKEPVGTVKWRYYKSIYSLRAILGNLTMFVISFVIGIKVLFSNKQNKNVIKQDNNEPNIAVQDNSTNSTLSDESIFQNKSEIYNSETTQEESIKQDIYTNNNTNITQDTNIIIQENTIYQEQLSNNYNEYIGYSFLGTSIIFLIITLYFFIKYQLKHLRKLSK